MYKQIYKSKTCFKFVTCNRKFSRKMNFESICEKRVLCPIKQISAKPETFMKRPHLHSFFPQNVSLNKVYIVYFLVFQHSYQGKNEIEYHYVIFTNWQNFLNAASSDSRPLSIPIKQLSMKGPSTIDVR